MPTAWDEHEKWSDAVESLYTDVERRRARHGDHAFTACGDWNVDITEGNEKASNWKWNWLDDMQQKTGLSWAASTTGEWVQDLDAWRHRSKPPNSRDWIYRLIDWASVGARAWECDIMDFERRPDHKPLEIVRRGRARRKVRQSAGGRCWLAKQRGWRATTFQERERESTSRGTSPSRCRGPRMRTTSRPRWSTWPEGGGPAPDTDRGYDADKLRECEQRRAALRHRAMSAPTAAERIRCARATWRWRLQGGGGGGAGRSEGRVVREIGCASPPPPSADRAQWPKAIGEWRPPFGAFEECREGSLDASPGLEGIPQGLLREVRAVIMHEIRAAVSGEG